MNCYLISYDIRCPRRLRRVHRLLKSRSHCLLESLYAFQGTPAELEYLRCLLWKQASVTSDEILIYRTRSDRSILRWGTACLPEGVYDFSLPTLIELRGNFKWAA